jgi:hypothetical protein
MHSFQALPFKLAKVQTKHIIALEGDKELLELMLKPMVEDHLQDIMILPNVVQKLLPNKNDHIHHSKIFRTFKSFGCP